MNAAQIAQGRGQLDDAASLFEKALGDGASDPSVRWSAHAGLADVAMARSRPDEASRHFEAALDTIEKTRSELLKTDYKLSFLTRLILFYQSYVDALVEPGPDRSRARSVRVEPRPCAGRPQQPGAAGSGERSAALRQVAAQVAHGRSSSYWLGGSRFVCLGRHRERHPASCRLPPASEIEPLVRQYQATINNTLADPLAGAGTRGRSAVQVLVEPVLPWVPAGTRVVIAADGALHGINFETLPVPGPKRALLD